MGPSAGRAHSVVGTCEKAKAGVIWATKHAMMASDVVQRMKSRPTSPQANEWTGWRGEGTDLHRVESQLK